jgi:endo-1,4-beta-xylanase
MRKHGGATRREFVAGALGTGVASMLGLVGPVWAEGKRSLKAIAAEKGILFGSSVGVGKPGTLTGSFSDTGYRDILKNECAVLVPENELKSYVIAAQPGTYNFEPADRIAQFASSNGMKLRGHTLLWNRVEYTPKWLLDQVASLSASAAEQFLRDYIKRVCTHYGTQIYSWDVVNETIDPKSGQLRDTPFTKVLGFDALRIAFEAAREYAPRVQLVYNDYMSWEAGNEQHRDGVLRLLEQFKAKNVPVDALGVQSHIGNDGRIQDAQSREWRTFIDEVVRMGYKLLITEFDVNDKDLPGDPATRDAQVAAAAKGYLDLMLSYRQLDQVLCWGMVDKFSWLQSFSKRADQTPQRPTPYDDNYRPKPLRDAIAAAFASAPKRTFRQ